MAENKEENNAEQSVVSISPAAANRKREKKTWTEAKCKKVAGRFSSEEAWKKGSPSSYKAAVSHKWVKNCLEHQEWRQSEIGAPVSLPASA